MRQHWAGSYVANHKNIFDGSAQVIIFDETAGIGFDADIFESEIFCVWSATYVY
jgi:hypothetical protein